MPVYEYKALNKRGKSVTGIVDADSSLEARTKLRDQEVFITDLSETTAVQEKKGSTQITLFSRIRPMDVSVMIRLLSTLLNAGIPLLEALSAIIDEHDHKGLKKILSQVRESVREGRSFADALAPHSRVFSPLMVNMIRSGESSGSLEIVLLRLADFLEQHGLVFSGFNLDNAAQSRFARAFPDDPLPGTLANWAAFERDNPRTFEAMYCLWCRRAD